MHSQAEKVCTAIFCLPATFSLDFVKICVRPQGCVFPGTLCIVAEKRWSVGAQPPSGEGASVPSGSWLGSSLLCQGLAFAWITLTSVWLGSFLFVYILSWFLRIKSANYCIDLTPTGFLNQPIVFLSLASPERPEVCRSSLNAHGKVQQLQAK